MGDAGAVGKRAPVVITSLPSAGALAETSEALAAAGHAGQIIIETSTLPIEVKQAARKRLAPRRITLLDCPLSGTSAQARTEDLVVLASGAKSAYRKCIPVFEGFARAHYLVGPFGDGSKMKFIANLLVRFITSRRPRLWSSGSNQAWIRRRYSR